MIDLDENELLQSGVVVETHAGSSLQDFLCGELGLTPQYIAERIATVFIDGKVADKLDSVVIQEGSIVALSAALPGLAGAALRRGGTYAALRTSITRSADSASKASSQNNQVVHFKVKLFNLLIDELGPLLLSRRRSE